MTKQKGGETLQSDTKASVERQSRAIQTNVRRDMNNSQNITRWLMIGILTATGLGGALASDKIELGAQAQTSSARLASKQTTPDQLMPFQGSVNALEVYQVTPPTMLVHTTGTGEGTHLGQFKVTWEYKVMLQSGLGIGTAHFVAEDGDSFDTKSLEQGDMVTGDLARITEIHAIVAGTGRFAGAEGCFSLERLVNTNSGATSGLFHGTIVYATTK
jgi:hypothetical protein